MLSGDIMTEFRGRSTQIHVYPLSFEEYYSFVGGDETKRSGIVLAKSSKAKQFGIVTGETLYSARQKCRNLQVYQGNYKVYRELYV